MLSQGEVDIKRGDAESAVRRVRDQRPRVEACVLFTVHAIQRMESVANRHDVFHAIAVATECTWDASNTSSTALSGLGRTARNGFGNLSFATRKSGRPLLRLGWSGAL